MLVVHSQDAGKICNLDAATPGFQIFNEIEIHFVSSCAGSVIERRAMPCVSPSLSRIRCLVQYFSFIR
jgi:hypothetical protein